MFQRTLRMGGWSIQAEVSLIVLGKFPAVSVLSFPFEVIVASVPLC